MIIRIATFPSRSEGVLVLAGGLIIHTFQDFSAFSEKNAKPIYKEFDRAVNDASLVPDVSINVNNCLGRLLMCLLVLAN